MYIYDRNILDVNYAKELIDKYKAGGLATLSETEIRNWNEGLRGVLNYTDLNRIESNCRTLLDALRIAGTTKSNWSTLDIPKATDFTRILTNVSKIRSQGYFFSATPNVPVLPVNDYKKLNDIEKILFDAYTLYERNRNNIDYIDEIYLNEEIGVM